MIATLVFRFSESIQMVTTLLSLLTLNAPPCSTISELLPITERAHAISGKG